MRIPTTLLMVIGCLIAPGATAKGPLAIPKWLPRYDLDIQLNIKGHSANVRQRVTWINRHPQPTDKLVFNVHSRYEVPKADVGLMAKTLELLRVNPSNAMETSGRACHIRTVTLLQAPYPIVPASAQLPFHFEGDTETSMVVVLPAPVKQGQSVSVVIDFHFRLPQKMGRWGQWKGVTFLTNWLPVLAYYDEKGWIPTPFVPWHQPFFNESGIYHARVTLPADQKVGCTGIIRQKTLLTDGMIQLDIEAIGVRDFSFLCSARYKVFSTPVQCHKDMPPILVQVLAFPEHAHYAEKILQIAKEAIPVYQKWFGPYPYPILTLAESYFGWNGNECSTLIMIDERVLGMPHLADRYVDYLVSHEISHQWWYNVVGTNGFAETWMDESLATYFSHKLMTAKYGNGNDLLRYPKGLRWLPNIRRKDYRFYGMYGTIGRGANSPVVQDMPSFGHLANLFNMCYDKGSRIVGMIAERLGDTGFQDFTRIVYRKYAYRVLRVKDYQRELELYTGRSWEEFFQFWLYGEGLCDWAIDKVKLERVNGIDPGPVPCDCKKPGTYKATILLKQKGKFSEQTTLGIAFGKKDCYPLRIPIIPQLPELELPEEHGRVVVLPDNRVQVDLLLSCKPSQITVDPDQILVDKHPTNNFWKKPVRVRFTPLYTFLEETDLTNSFDRWNLLFGPWVHRSAYDDPWYSGSTLFGLRGGAYRTQHFRGGAYIAYRTDFRDVVVGADGLLDHWPHPRVQLGYHAEQRIAKFQSGRDTPFRGAVFARYVLQHGSSLYLPNFKYVEGFGTYQNNFLPFARNHTAGAQRFESLYGGGVHYHLNYLTPYWDPVAGIQIDATYEGGGVRLADGKHAMHQVFGQVSFVQNFPDVTKLHDGPVAHYLSNTRFAFRAYGAAGLPDQAEYFTMGGGTLFRGYDQAERHGSIVWVASLEWRAPLVKEVRWDVFDHVIGVRNVSLALFYDVGDALTNGHSIGPVSHALGAGLRFDTAIFGFIERATFRMDIAKTVNDDTPIQFWMGLLHPF